MKIDLITGFLGAGKTTFIQYYARFLRSQAIPFCVIENEFGQAGIDGAILKEDIGDIRELSGGCICCGMKVQFYDLLLQLAQSGRYERILVEPSGVFSPCDFFDVALSPEIARYASIGAIVSVVEPRSLARPDAAVADMLFEQLKYASFVLVSRLCEERTQEFRQTLCQIYHQNGSVLPPEQEIAARPWDDLTPEWYARVLARTTPPMTYAHRRQDHAALFHSTTLYTKRAYTLSALDELVRRVTSGEYGEVLRVKGYVNEQGAGTILINCTPEANQFTHVERTAAPSVNIIGRHIRRQEIRRLFEEAGQPTAAETG